MALLTDKETKQDLSERLEEFGQFGMVFNYMLDENDIDLLDLERIFFDSDRDKVMLVYTKLLSKMKPEYLNVSFSRYSTLFPNNDGLDDMQYNNYLNKCCLTEMISRMSSEDKLDKTYLNTYSFLLNNSDGIEAYARK